jgi:hypothetical protein
MVQVRRIFGIALAALFVLGCRTPSVEPEGEAEPIEPAVVAAEPEPEEAPEEVVEVEPEPDEKPVIDLDEEIGAVVTEPEPIDVPDVVYDQAFDEVEAVIAELNGIIYRGDFDAWLEYLTDRYRAIYSDPNVLAEVSRQPYLAQSYITVRSIEDYFEHVVRPSRPAGATLDDLVFYSDTLVEAVTTIRGEPAILYLLRKVDGEWKIDTF